MKKPIYKRKRLWGIVAVAVFFLGLTLSNYIKYIDNKYVGEVTAISDVSITLLDRSQGEETLSIGDRTNIIHAGTDEGIIKVGDNVMVIFKKDQGKLSAERIRVLKKKNTTTK